MKPALLWTAAATSWLWTWLEGNLLPSGVTGRRLVFTRVTCLPGAHRRNQSPLRDQQEDPQRSSRNMHWSEVAVGFCWHTAHPITMTLFALPTITCSHWNSKCKNWCFTFSHQTLTFYDFSSLVVDFLQRHRLQSTRFLHPWDFPGKNTGVGSDFLLQGTFPTEVSNPRLLFYHAEKMFSFK